MRTTIDLDKQTYNLAKALSAQKGVTLGRIVAEALARQYGQPAPSPAIGKSKAGFPVLTLGHPITPEDVAELQDE